GESAADGTLAEGSPSMAAAGRLPPQSQAVGAGRLTVQSGSASSFSASANQSAYRKAGDCQRSNQQTAPTAAAKKADCHAIATIADAHAADHSLRGSINSLIV